MFIKKYTRNFLLILALGTTLGSCKKYLDLKPNGVQVVPSTLADCQYLLDNYFTTAESYPTNEQSADNYYITTASWNGLVSQDRDVYVWAPQAQMRSDDGWLDGYQKPLTSNTCLETLAKIDRNADTATYDFIKGQSLFYRGFAFYMIAQVWAPPYVATSAKTDLGIDLRLTSDISAESSRSTLQQTYDQVISDLKQAVSLLPADQPTSVLNKARPYRGAAYAALARTYLAMSDYTNAAVYANASLNNYSTLMDYNQLDSTVGFPIVRYNPETLFEAAGWLSFSLRSTTARVDSNLFASYDSLDLRRAMFFKENTGANTGTYQFRGSYDASNSLTVYCGFATDEMYLTRAECEARAGDASAAMADLNTLLVTRWKTGTYTNRTAVNAADALAQVLTERRKELLFRSLRWTDLRRLNLDPAFATTLTRVINGTVYTLPPNDLRYTMLIPLDIEKIEPLTQNPR